MKLECGATTSFWYQPRCGSSEWEEKKSLLWHRVWFHIWMNLALLFFVYESNTQQQRRNDDDIPNLKANIIKTEVRVPNMKFMTFSHHFDSFLPTVDACWWFWHLFFCYACCVYFSFLNRSECCCRLWRRARLKTSAKYFAFQLSVWLLCLHLIKIKSKAFLHFIYFIMPNWISQTRFCASLLPIQDQDANNFQERKRRKRWISENKVFFGTFFIRVAFELNISLLHTRMKVW